MPDNFRTRERYGEAFWHKHQETWQQSALNQREYCEAHGIPLKAFGNWRARFKAEPQRNQYRRSYQNLKGLMNVGSLVVVEPSTALHAKAALGDHSLQQNARPFGQAGPVLGIVLFDAQHHVEAHRVHEAEGAGL